jgi:hypothetical protein
LLAVREGEIWRVQIVWPNGSVHYFGQLLPRKTLALGSAAMRS